MKFPLLDILAPHYCCSCGKIGEILCDYCKYNIGEDLFSKCLVCLSPTSGQRSSLCQSHGMPYTKAWCVGMREGVLEVLIDSFKFQRKRAASEVLGELLDMTLPSLPPDTIVTFVPTLAKHVRVRGYDHAELVARDFARRRRLVCKSTLIRSGVGVQHGSGRKIRIEQAKRAFTPRHIENVTYLLIDDIFTTGATLEYASRALVDGGAKDVWCSALVRQPLEKQ